MNSLSVIIIAKNEAHDIGDCIRSVLDIASEIVVLDSGSTDGTQRLCRDLGAKVIETDWPGFGPQKNRALAAASGDWILSLDADERLDAEACRAVLAAMKGNAPFAACRLRRDTVFCGRRMNRAGIRPDMLVRLFRRGAGRFADVAVHERFLPEGEIGTLPGRILHITASTVGESLEKMNLYSTLSAETLRARGRRTSLVEALSRGVCAFFRSYFLRLGLLDGREGIFMAVLDAEGAYYKYAKLLAAGPDRRPGR